MSSRGAKNSQVLPVQRGLNYRRKVSVHFGVSAYQHWPSLNNGASDATDLANRFKIALNFDQQIVVLNEEVTKERIETVFRDLSKCHADDLIVVTWSGHGCPFKLANNKDAGFLVPYDAPFPISLSNAMEYVEMTEIGNWADKYLKTRHVVFLLDCCFPRAIAHAPPQG